MFHYQDHSSDDTLAVLIATATRMAGKKLGKDEHIDKIIDEIKLTKLKLIAEIPELTDYQSVEKDQFPGEVDFFQWLIETQNQALGLGKPVMADFHRPIQLEMLLLPNALM